MTRRPEPVAAIAVTFETWREPRPAGDGLHGVLLMPDGTMAEAEMIYGLIRFGSNAVPPVGIGEPLTFEAKKRYVTRMLADVFGGDRDPQERNQ